MDAAERDALLGRLDERTENIKETIEVMEIHQKEQNGRLGVLETWMQRVLGAGALLGLMSPLFIFGIRDVIVDLFK
ncbi:hypothetical protein LCGC14_0442410 [marine sediment metagenome]|uniref:Uncharacterized protein n=1 Tax=marine sediment metagenome TaxID=412755 RepID=A0A0F9V6T6_9ZZZZ